jgi:drug/metabolite transporter (DMT)-like permease
MFAPVEQSKYGLGVFLVVVGGVFLSTSGLMLRLIEHADGWQILFFRGLAFSTTLFVILVFNYRRDTAKAFRNIGRRGLLVALALGFASCFYIFALLLTTVANAMFIIGSAPLATAFGAWLMLGERTSPVGLITMIGALGGIGLLFADGYAAGHWLGNLAALCVVVGFVVYLLIVRGSPNTDMLPAICLSGLVMTMVGFIGADHLIMDTRDLLFILTMGCVQFSVGFMCYTLAARHILASEVAFFALAESILAPIWVWIGVGETPSSLALIGIAIVLTFVTLYGVFEISRERRLV